MRLAEIQWKELDKRGGAELKSDVFEILQCASRELLSGNDEDVSLLELIPRLNELIVKHPELSSPDYSSGR